MGLKFKPVVFIILDGFGITSPSDSNAVWTAKTPYIDKMTKHCPTMLLEASSLNVGLPTGEVGNSEVGHMNLGSGLLIYQSLPRIDKAIENKTFFQKEHLVEAVKKSKEENSNFHIMGLLGNGGIHSHTRHLMAIIDFCEKNNLKNVYLHLFLDGRDTGKDSAKLFMKDLLSYSKKGKICKVASLCGRYYAMDRNHNWDRIEVAYNAIAKGQSKKTNSDPLRAIEESYKNNIFDEQFEPTVITNKDGSPVATIKKEDTVLFLNFRADRARQITKVFVDPKFKKFDREFLQGLNFITMAEYEKGLPVKVLYPPFIVKNPLAKVISDNGLKQLHIAETEKYAHVTFFINGLREEKFPGEDRILIPSPAVSSYDEKPEMSSVEVSDKIIDSIKNQKHDFIFVNYANPDMVGHTGNLQATIKAVEALDRCLARVVNTTVNYGGRVFIVGDHGNAEELIKMETGKVDKEHSVYPVPFIAVCKTMIGKNIHQVENGDLSTFAPTGILSDVTSTILKSVGLPIAPEMTGSNLLEGF